MKRRVGTAALAILLALLGTVGVLGYVRDANTRALDGQKAITVMVAAQRIPAGTSAGAAARNGWLRSQTFPAASVPADAVLSVSAGLRALVVDQELPAGELLVRPMLSIAVPAHSVLAIPNGMVMVTLPLCLSQAVAGFIHAGSEVSVFSTSGIGTITQSNCGQTTQQLQGAKTRLVLLKVLVLAVGPAQPGGASSTSTSKTGIAQAGSAPSAQAGSAPSAQSTILLTFAATQEDAQTLINLSQTGLPYLALLTSTSDITFDGRSTPPINPAKG